MRSFDSPCLADWFAVSLRWLALLDLATGLALTGGMKLTTGAALLFGTLWNVSNTILAIQNRRAAPKWHKNGLPAPGPAPSILQHTCPRRGFPPSWSFAIF